MRKTRVILGSNYELWWEGLSCLLERQEDMELSGVCYDSSTILSQTSELKPEVVLLDEEIAGGNCGALVQQLTDLDPEIKVMIVVPPYKHADLSNSLKAGAKGYIDKNITFQGLINAIKQVVKGGLVIVSPQVVHEFVEQVGSAEHHRDNTQSQIENLLSRREREILALLSIRSITNREIAQKLFITESTVKAHLSNILDKMHVRNRQEAAMLAREKIHVGAQQYFGTNTR